MENKINIAELLKDCPKGMELYSPIFGKVYLDKVRPHLGVVVTTDKAQGDLKEEFLYDGRYGMNGECMLFPSKSKTTWEGFVPPCKFKDGDVVVTTLDNLAIIKERSISSEYRTYCLLLNDITTRIRVCPKRLATEEEKQKLFQAIKDNGYHWNPETKTLEKLVKPKFKVGDRIVKQNSISNLWIVSSISSQYYGLNLLKGGESIDVLPISEQDDWELIMGIRELAPNIEPKFKVGDMIQDVDKYKVKITEVNLEDECYGYESMIAKGIGAIPFKEQNNWELVPNKFDINTLIPFESRVLVRHSMDAIWKPAVFGFRNGYNNNAFYVVGGSCWNQCIPYLNNEHLCGTTNDCDGFYKTW